MTTKNPLSFIESLPVVDVDYFNCDAAISEMRQGLQVAEESQQPLLIRLYSEKRTATTAVVILPKGRFNADVVFNGNVVNVRFDGKDINQTLNWVALSIAQQIF
jgi:hypothetical protein